MSNEQPIASTSAIPNEHEPARIFQDCKFFIQKDLPQQVQEELRETIKTLGGRIEEKVPRNGFVLVQIGSAEAERLKICWKAPNRPDRHFVPYTYVEACKSAGTILEQIFTINGEPMRMHIHSSIANVNVRLALSQRIMHSGGDPTATAQDAHVILADPNTEVFQHLCKTYQNVADKHIESWLWVKKSVERGAVVFTPVVWKNPGGRRAGEERIHFTDEDEENLCRWIAIKIPYKAHGGRTGNKLYQQLCDMSNNPAYAWVNRHTWQSWRERYKKNASRLDPIIASIVEKLNIRPGDPGQHNFVRQPNSDEAVILENVKKKSKKNSEDSGSSASAHPVSPPPPRGGIVMDLNGRVPPPPEYGQVVLDDSSFPGIPPTNGDEDDDEWAIRIGNEPPPAWSGPSSAKRPRPSDDEHSMLKKAKTTIAPEVLDIATTYRFTVQEVEESMAKCGDVERTRRRFQEMRRLADSVPL